MDLGKARGLDPPLKKRWVDGHRDFRLDPSCNLYKNIVTDVADPSNKCHASSNKCLTSSNKKLLELN